MKTGGVSGGPATVMLPLPTTIVPETALLTRTWILPVTFMCVGPDTCTAPAPLCPISVNGRVRFTSIPLNEVSWTTISTLGPAASVIGSCPVAASVM
jgi:hypothetical protein